jgi:hypothetical protein
MQFAPLSPTDICNKALGKMGQQAIGDIDDQNSSAAQQCAANFWQVIREVGRAHNWNCLQRRVPLPQLSLPGGYSGDCTAIGWRGGAPATLPPYWLANTAYLGGNLVTYGEAIYYCLQANTSSAWFVNDMTSGLWAQIYSTFLGPYSPGRANGYEWNYGYVLPPDYLLITELNGNDCRRGRGEGSLYELFVYQTANPDGSASNVQALFCNDPFADVKYTALIQDTTIFDALFVNCVATLLAAAVSTTLRGDDGKMRMALEQEYASNILPNAMLKDSGERKERRYDPTKESNFLRSRYGSTAG